MSARDQILGKIRQIQTEKKTSPQPALPEGDVFPKMNGPLVDHFVQNCKAVQGEVFLCCNFSEVATQLHSLINRENWKNVFCFDSGIQSLLNSQSIPFQIQQENFLKMEAGITSCEHLIALTGGVLVHSKFESGRRMNVFPPVHIILANVSQIVASPEDALNRLKSKYLKNNFPSMFTIITGPSRTADIEKTLIMGAHGPKRLIIFINQSN